MNKWCMKSVGFLFYQFIQLSDNYTSVLYEDPLGNNLRFTRFITLRISSSKLWRIPSKMEDNIALIWNRLGWG